MSYPVIIYMRAKKGQSDHVISLINASRSVFEKTDNNCLEYKVYEDRNAPESIMIYEVWKTNEDFLIHLDSFGIPLAQTIQEYLESLIIHELQSM